MAEESIAAVSFYVFCYCLLHLSVQGKYLGHYFLESCQFFISYPRLF